MNLRSLAMAAWLTGAAGAPVLAQQTGSFTVTVTRKQTGQPIRGANVTVEGTRLGAVTNDQGRATVSGVPIGAHTVNVRFLGFSEVRRHNVQIQAGPPMDLSVSMEEAVLSLQAVVVSGVTDPTAGMKLPYTVSRVDTNQLQIPTTGSALAALQGKVAGVNIIRGSGKPGAGVDILLRSPTAFEGTNSPLYVVDGVVLARDLSGIAITGDIESEDIESVEVIKGAAAASLYGSRAASGVISITTRRGRNVPRNQTRVTSRFEMGKDWLAGTLPPTTSHHYLMNASGTALVNSSGRDTLWSGRTARPCSGRNDLTPCGRFADQPYPGPTYDNLHALYNPGQFISNSVSVAQNTDATTFRLGMTRLDQAGALANNDGFQRTTARLNLDHRIGDKFSIQFTGDHSRSYDDEISGSPYTSILTYPVFVNLAAKGPDGNYLQVPDSSVELENPLWRQASRDNFDKRSRTQGSLSSRWALVPSLTLDAQLSYDRVDTKQQTYVPEGTPIFSNNERVPSDGELDLIHRENDAFNGAVGATLTRQFGQLNSRFSARGTFERESREEFSAVGTNFLVGETRDLTAAGTIDDIASSTSDIRTNGYFGDLALDYKDRYVGSVLVRRDGSSLFGPLAKWHTYKRAAAAWLVSRESFFRVKGIDELKLRYAMGEAGGRPSFSQQYESWSVSRTGGLSRETAGNPSLRPQFSREQEIGIDMLALDNRLQLELVRAWQTTKDQIIIVPATVITGYSSVSANAAVIKGRTYEATMSMYPLRTRNWTWSIDANAHNSRTKLVEWGRSCFWGSNADREHERTCAGEQAGDFWMERTVRSSDELPSWLTKYADEFAVNDDGYLVWVGKDPATGQTNSWRDGLTVKPNQCRTGLTTCGWGSSFSARGFTYRWGEPFRAWDEVNDEVRRVRMGSSLPDVAFGFGSNLRYKGLSSYLGLRGAVGGKVYNETRMWYYANLRHGDLDQRGKPNELKKTVDYYQRALAQNDAGFVDLFLEDGTYLKLGEARLSYRLSREQSQRLLRSLAPADMTLGINARNLFTLTKYGGFDPEVGSPLSRVDNVDYPFTRTLTFTFDINF